VKSEGRRDLAQYNFSKRCNRDLWLSSNDKVVIELLCDEASSRLSSAKTGSIFYLVFIII